MNKAGPWCLVAGGQRPVGSRAYRRAHPCASTSFGPTLQLLFSGQTFVVRKNLRHGIQATETGQVQIRHSLVDLCHPAFDRCLHATRHLPGNILYKVARVHQSDYLPFFVSGQWPVVSDQSSPLNTDHRPLTTSCVIWESDMHRQRRSW